MYCYRRVRKSKGRLDTLANKASRRLAVEQLEHRLLLTSWPPGNDGWLDFDTWHQGSPYNQFAPLDPSKPSARSDVGCTATAEAQLAYYWQFPETLSFSGAADDYDFSVEDGNGNVFSATVDDDSTALDFPSFSALNTELAEISYDNSNRENALLSFAVGIKAEMSYSSSGSGAALTDTTFERLGFGSADRYNGWDSTIEDRVIENLKSGMPVLLGISRPGATPNSPRIGHAVILEGYRDDNGGEFLVNLGWGGNDEWESLPVVATSSGRTYDRVDVVIYNILPTLGWSQEFADAQNTSRSPYAAPTEAREKWGLTTDNAHTFAGMIVGSGGDIFLANAANSTGDDSSLWVVNDFGDKINEIPLPGIAKNSIGYPAQAANGNIFVPTDDGLILRVKPSTGSVQTIYADPEAENIDSIKIDEDGFMYVSTSRKLVCLTQSGTVRWTYRYPSNDYQVSAEAAIDDIRDRVYVPYYNPTSKTSYLAMLDRTSGTLLHEKSFGSVSNNRNAGTPSIGPDGTVFVGNNGNLYALDPSDNLSQKWVIDTITYPTGAPPTVGRDGNLYIRYAGARGGLEDQVAAVDADAGTFLWTIDDLDLPFGAYVGNVYAAANDMLLFTVNEQVSDRFVVYAYGDMGASGYERAWEKSFASRAWNLALGPGNTLYVFGQKIAALASGTVGDPRGAGMGYQDNTAPDRANSPSVPLGGVVQSSTVDLAWEAADPDGHDLLYTVLLGAADADTGLMVPVASGIAEPHVVISGLNAGATYYWKVIATDGQSETVGPTWIFSTASTLVSVAASPASTLEDGTTNQEYTFTRTGVTTDALTVHFDVGGTAVFNDDYTQSGAATFSATSGTVTIAAGASTAVVTIDPSADTTVESDETVVLTVASGTGYTVGMPSEATGTIQNDDASGEVRGGAWNDLDRDGKWDAGEPGLEGRTIELYESVERVEPDQVNDPPTGISFGNGGDGGSLFQSFVPSTSHLVGIDLRLRTGGSFPSDGHETTINIREGNPAGSVLGSSTAFVPSPGVVGEQRMVHFDFETPIEMTSGNEYVVEWVQTTIPGVPANAILGWMGQLDDPYPAGNAFNSSGTAIVENDYNFVTHGLDRELTLADTAVTMADQPATPVDETGMYRFTGLDAATYTVAEIMQPGWEQTYPSDSGIVSLSHEHFIPGIEARPGYHSVRGVALSPDGSLLYAAHWQAGIVQSDDPIAVYSTDDFSLVNQIGGGQCVGDVVISNDGRYVYAPEYYGGYVHRYDTSNANAKTSIDLGSWADKLWKSPDGERIVVNYNSSSGHPSSHHSLALVDITGDRFSLIDTFNAGRPVLGMSAAFSDDGRHIYLSAGSNQISGPTLLDVNIAGTPTIEREVELAAAPNQDWRLAGVVRSGGTLYVADKTASKLHIVDGASFTKTDEVPLPETPSSIAIHHDGEHLLVLYGDSGTLSVMDLGTMSEQTRVSGLNIGLSDKVFSADGGKAYVSHYHTAQGGVSIIDVGIESGDGVHVVSLAAGETAEGINFGNHHLQQPPPTELASIRLETTDLEGSPISSALEGREFLLRGFVEDLRQRPTGVFAAYVDVTYEQDLVLPADGGDIVYGDHFPNAHAGNTSTPGLIDEVGAVANLDPLGDGEYLLFSVPMVATKEGTVTLAADPADLLPFHHTLLFGHDDIVATEHISYGTTVIDVLPLVVAVDDAAAADEDNFVDVSVLANDVGGSMAIIAYDTRTENGAVITEQAGGLLRYDPRGSVDLQSLAFGERREDSFTYTIRDARGTTATGTVTITVDGVNDAPVQDVVIPDQSAMPRLAFTLVVPDDAFVDPEDDLLTYSASLEDGFPLPGWLVFDPQTRTFSGTPTIEDLATIRVAVTATDSGQPNLSARAVFVITAYNPYQNSVDPLDVNADGFVTPLDALVVINDMNANGPRELPIPPQPPLVPPPFVDVNGDLFCTPIDALLILNFLNRQEAEGESPADAIDPAAANQTFPKAMELAPIRLGEVVMGHHPKEASISLSAQSVPPAEKKMQTERHSALANDRNSQVPIPVGELGEDLESVLTEIAGDVFDTWEKEMATDLTN